MLKQIFFCTSNDAIMHAWWIGIGLYHISPCKQCKSIFLIYPPDREVACQNCTIADVKYNAHTVYCSLIFLLLFRFTKDHLPSIHRRDPCGERLFLLLSREPRTRFYSAWGRVDRCDVSARHSTASLDFPIVATIPALMSSRHENDLHLSACFSFVLFLHSPTLIWH